MSSLSMKIENSAASSISRRDWINKSTFLVGGSAFLSAPAFAEDDAETVTEPASAEPVITAPEIKPKVSVMGGLLEKYQDGTRGFRMLAPSGWNKFEGEVGAYDVKWQDLVDPTENVKISTTPVKSTTTSV